MTVHLDAPASLPGIPRRKVVRLAAASEGILAAIALGWIAARDIPIIWEFDLTSFAAATLGVMVVVEINSAIFLSPRITRFRHPAWRQFTERVVKPLCADLDRGSALLVGVLAGFGEELLFRGVVFNELRVVCGVYAGVILSGVVFGWVHFIGVSRIFWPVVLFYALIGIILSGVYAAVPNLFLLIYIHALYDWLIIDRVRRSLDRTKASSTGKW